MTAITHARVKELLDYDPATGRLTWRTFMNGRAVAGQDAGCPWGKYLRVQIDGNTYLAHVLIWFYMTGEWPEETVDHEDRQGTHNWWSNLRLATYSQNNCNRPKQKNNNTGFKGVVRRGTKFRAQGTFNKKTWFLPAVATAEEAAAQYAAHAQKLHGAFFNQEVMS